MRLSDVSTGLKVLIAPVVAVSVFGMLAVLCYRLYSEIQDSGARVAAATTVQREVAQATSDFHKGLSTFYRAITWTYSKVEQKLIDEELKSGLKSIDEIQGELGAVQTGDAEAMQIIGDVKPALQKFHASLDFVAAALAADPFVASMMMSDVNVRAREIEAALTKLSGLTLKRMEDVKVASDAETRSAVRLFAIVGIVAMLVSLLLAFLIGRLITRPIVQITGAMRQLADGDLDVEVAGADRRDEIGAMASAMTVFKDNARRVAQLREEQDVQEREAARLRRAELDALATNFEGSVKGLVGLVASSATTMQRLSHDLKITATDSTDQATNVTTLALESASSVTSVANAAEELAGSISEITVRTNQSATAAQSAADRGRSTVAIAQGLTTASDRIGEVVGVIQSIAAQTNLLALNATIEAARAGEAGRGFAVVAHEVKQLSIETTRATGDIREQITSLQAATTEVLAAIELIGNEISDVYSHAASIAIAVEEQRAVVDEISRSASSVAQSTQIVSQEIASVREGAETTATAAQRTHEVSSELGQQAHRLEEDVANFLRTVRAA